MNKEKYKIGVDVGGTHVTCALLDTTRMELVADSVTRVELRPHEVAELVLDTFAGALRTCAGDDFSTVASIGFAFPGPFNYPAGICLIPPELRKYESLYGVNIRSELARRLAFHKPIRFLNDAACFALGEYCLGAAQGSRRTLALALGTGFGSTFLADGVPVTEGSTVPLDGMLWHVDYQGRIADESFSTRGLVKAWQDIRGETLPGVREIAALAQAGDARALSLFEAWGGQMAECIGPWVTAFGVDTIVLGGNIAKSGDFFVPALTRGIEKEIRLKPAVLGEAAQMIGAAFIEGDI